MIGMWRLAGIGQRAFAALRAWQLNMRQRRELLLLNDVELRDISLSAADVNREAGKPIWETIRFAGR
jgi:uncharacterized protein YjiS (DUF1127 family)